MGQHCCCSNDCIRTTRPRVCFYEQATIVKTNVRKNGFFAVPELAGDFGRVLFRDPSYDESGLIGYSRDVPPDNLTVYAQFEDAEPYRMVYCNYKYGSTEVDFIIDPEDDTKMVVDRNDVGDCIHLLATTEVVPRIYNSTPSPSLSVSGIGNNPATCITNYPTPCSPSVSLVITCRCPLFNRTVNFDLVNTHKGDGWSTGIASWSITIPGSRGNGGLFVPAPDGCENAYYPWSNGAGISLSTSTPSADIETVGKGAAVGISYGYSYPMNIDVVTENPCPTVGDGGQSIFNLWNYGDRDPRLPIDLSMFEPPEGLPVGNYYDYVIDGKTRWTYGFRLVQCGSPTAYSYTVPLCTLGSITSFTY